MKSNGLWVFKTWWWNLLHVGGCVGIPITIFFLFIHDILYSYGVIPYGHFLEKVVTWVGGITMGIWALMAFLYLFIDLIERRE